MIKKLLFGTWNPNIDDNDGTVDAEHDADAATCTDTNCDDTNARLDGDNDADGDDADGNIDGDNGTGTDDDLDADPPLFVRDHTSELEELHLYADDPSMTGPDDFPSPKWREQPMVDDGSMHAGSILGGLLAPKERSSLRDLLRHREPVTVTPIYF